MSKDNIIKICIAATIALVLMVLLFSNLKTLSFHQINDFINDGNEKFDEKKYDEAKIKYAGALNIDSLSSGTLYNHANADYRNDRYEAADKTFSKAITSSLKSNATKQEKSLISNMYHNKGNANMKRLTPLDSILMMNEMIEKMEKSGQDVNQEKQQFYNSLQNNLQIVQTPIKDYKEALRSDPENDSTRFNLALAQNYEKKVAAILQNMTPPSNGGQNDQNQDKKDDQKQDQQNQQQEQKQDQQQEEQQNPNQMSKENAEQILKALEQEEKDQQKKRKVEQQNSRFNTDKDW